MNHIVKDLHNKSIAEIVAILGIVPLEATLLDLSENELYKRSGAELAEILRAIPPHIKSIRLSQNGLAKMPAPELAIALRAIPSHITTLDLSRNNVYRKQGSVILGVNLAIIWKAIPAHVTTLDLSFCNLGSLPSSELISAFAEIPRGVKKLILSFNNLGSKASHVLAMVLSAAPAHLTALDLSGNDLGNRSKRELLLATSKRPEYESLKKAFNSKPETDLTSVIPALPSGLIELNLSNNNLNFLPSKVLPKVLHELGKRGITYDVSENFLGLEPVISPALAPSDDLHHVISVDPKFSKLSVVTATEAASVEPHMTLTICNLPKVSHSVTRSKFTIDCYIAIGLSAGLSLLILLMVMNPKYATPLTAFALMGAGTVLSLRFFPTKPATDIISSTTEHHLKV